MKSFNRRSKFIHRARGAIHDQYTYEDNLSEYNFSITKFSEGFCYFSPLTGSFLPKPHVFTFDDDDDALQAFLENNPGFKASDK